MFPRTIRDQSMFILRGEGVGRVFLGDRIVSGGTEWGSVVANRVKGGEGEYRKRTANDGGGVIRRVQSQVNVILTQPNPSGSPLLSWIPEATVSSIMR